MDALRHRMYMNMFVQYSVHVRGWYTRFTAIFTKLYCYLCIFFTASLIRCVISGYFLFFMKINLELREKNIYTHAVDSVYFRRSNATKICLLRSASISQLYIFERASTFFLFIHTIFASMLCCFFFVLFLSFFAFTHLNNKIYIMSIKSK